MDPAHGARLLEAVQRRGWDGSFHEVLIPGFVCVCSASVVVIVPSVSSPSYVSISRGCSEPCSHVPVLCYASSHAPFGAQNKAMCALLAYCWFFPLPIYMFSIIYTWWSIPFTLDSVRCTSEVVNHYTVLKIKWYYAKERFRCSLEHLAFMLFLNPKFGVFRLYLGLGQLRSTVVTFAFITGVLKLKPGM